MGQTANCQCCERLADPHDSEGVEQSYFENRVGQLTSEFGRVEADVEPGPSDMSNAVEIPIAEKVSDGDEKKFSFVFEPGQVLGANITEMTNAENVGLLVIRSLSSDSVISVTKSGKPGLCPGDVILKIKDLAGSPAELFDRWKTVRDEGGEVTVSVITRPEEFDVEFRREDNEKMGFMVGIVGERVTITQFLDQGAALAWNKNNWKTQIVGGDEIVAVNGTTDTPKAMTLEMQKLWKDEKRLSIRVKKAPQV
eukprot:TRINITY_DN63957_c0_g1_i1.p1 TRINITY_DN63957_c0_g1~~TRINITY_DN63957_c0_g1_i1.p1  ORF type:complete len:253 (-),score=48.74 TRINITY_DN63957_c0_g1_i1:71-829(-)